RANDRAAHIDGAVEFAVVEILSAEPVDVVVEYDAGDAAIAVEQRAARIAADHVVGAGEVEHDVAVEPLARFEPARRQRIRVLAGGPLVEAGDVGERRDGLAARLGPTGDAAVGQARTGGRVRVLAFAE